MRNTLYLLAMLCLYTTTQAAHLKTLVSRMMHTSAVLSAMKYETFPKDDPYLFVATNNCTDDNVQYHHGIRSFNRGQGVLFAAIKHTIKRKDPDNPVFNERANIAQILLESVDTEPLATLLDKYCNEFFVCASKPIESAKLIESALYKGAQQVTTQIAQACTDKKYFYRRCMNSSTTGLIYAAFRCAYMGNGNFFLYAYPVTSNQHKIITIEPRVYDEINLDLGSPKKNRFDNIHDWCIDKEGLDYCTKASFYEAIASLKREDALFEAGLFIEAFAEEHMQTNRSARLIVLNAGKLKEAIKGDA